MWIDSQKTSTSGYDGSDTIVYHDIVQVLQHTRKYHFDDVYVCFIRDDDNYSFIQCLLMLPIIQYEGTYKLKKMTEAQMIAYVTQLYEAQQKQRAEDATAMIAKQEAAEKEVVTID